MSTQPELFGDGRPGLQSGLELDPQIGGLDVELADRALAELLAAEWWRQDEIVMFGKRMPVPRLQAWFGDPGSNYSYSGIALDPLPWTPLLAEVRDRCSELAGVEFDSVLCNLYRDGRDGVDWHADDERELGPEPVIASVTLGAARPFQFKRKDGRPLDDGSTRLEILPQHGDVVVMRGLTQALWLHRIPKTKRPVDPRINLTFRRIVG